MKIGGLVRFRILGSLEARHGDDVVPLGGRQARAVLAILVTRAGSAVTTATLIDLLWPVDPPASAAKAIQVYVSQLRKAFDAVQPGSGTTLIRTNASGYTVPAANLWLDSLEFERLIASAAQAEESGRCDTALQRLAEADSLWRGDPLADFPYELFAQSERVRLEELRLSGLEMRMRCLMLLGRAGDAVPELESLSMLHPQRESLVLLRMQALFLTGRQADALASFNELRRTLAAQGLDPSEEVRELHLAVLRQDSTRVVPRSASLANALPAATTSFVGRSADLARVSELLAENRLVTLTGPGGAGKSRLALEVARQGSPLAPYLLEVGELGDLSGLASALADAWGVTEGLDQDPLAAALTSWGSRPALLILDDVDRIIEDASELTQRVLSHCPGVQILVTSRESLLVPGEMVHVVGALPVGDAVDLFWERAGVAPGQQEQAVATRIARKLDGLPLAVELAASLTRTMTPQEISERLDLLPGLEVESRSVLPRHRTLRAVVAWSFSMLEEAELRLTRGLSVFRGGFTMAAAEAVGGEGLAVVLQRLVNKSVVVVESRSGSARYRLLETVRAVAAADLEEAGETAAWQQAHADYYLSLAERADARLKGAEQGRWLVWIRRETDNIRAAMEFFVLHADPESQCRLAAALWRPAYLSGNYGPTRDWLEAALKSEGLTPDVRARGLHGAGALALYQCEYAAAEVHLQEAVLLFEELDDPGSRAGSLTLLGSIARERGDYVSALQLHGESEAISRAAGDQWGIAQAAELASLSRWLMGDGSGSFADCQRALDAARAVGDEERIGWCRIDLAAIAHFDDDDEEALRQVAAAEESFERLGFAEGLAWTNNLAGWVHVTRGDSDAAVRSLLESLRLHRELGDRWRLSSIFEALSSALVARGSLSDAAVVLAVAERMRTVIGAPVPPCERQVVDETRRAIDEGLAPQAVERSHRRGSSLSLDEACRRVLEVIRPRTSPEAT